MATRIGVGEIQKESSSRDSGSMARIQRRSRRSSNSLPLLKFQCDIRCHKIAHNRVFDVEFGGGMTTTVGRLRPCAVFDWKFTLLSHNTIRGAAGAALLNAELLKSQGYLE